MRVLFTYFVPSGGVETLNRTRCIALRQIGIEGHLLYLHDGAGRQNIHDIPLFITNCDQDIVNILNTFRYDAIVTVCDHLMLQRLRGLGYGGPILYDAQGYGSREAAVGTLHAASFFVRMYGNAVLAQPSSHMLELVNAIFPDFPRFFLQNIVDKQLFHYRPAPWLNPENAPILAWVGRIEPNKNWPLFLELGAALAARYPLLQLWMFEDPNISEPAQRAAFEAAVHALGLQDRLRLFPNIPHDHMAYYYSAIGDSGGLLVSTSHIEGFGYAVAEAAACRCPVLSTDSDGVRNTIIHNITGKLFPLDVSSGIQEAISLIEDSALRTAIRLQGENYVQETFSAARYAADFHNVLVALGIRQPA